MMTAVAAFAQQAKPVDDPRFFRLDFVLKELEGGKVLNSRAYTMSISTSRGPDSSIRTGSKVPTPGKDGGIIYVELGTSIDCRQLMIVGNDLSIYVNADVSSLAEGSTNPPVIRQNKWGAVVLIPLRKPTVVFSSDDPMSKRQMQLEVTATPIIPQ
jgi:hypothetical protein